MEQDIIDYFCHRLSRVMNNNQIISGCHTYTVIVSLLLLEVFLILLRFLMQLLDTVTETSDELPMITG